jgi:hypothetical protein
VADAGHAKLGERRAVWLAELTDRQTVLLQFKVDYSGVGPIEGDLFARPAPAEARVAGSALAPLSVDLSPMTSS